MSLTFTGFREPAAVLLTSARVQLATQWAHPMSIMLGIVQPAVMLLIAGSAARSGGTDLGRFAVASGLSTLWGASIWTAGGILRREIEYGTLPRLVCSPWSTRLLLTAKSLAAGAFQALSIGLTTAVVLVGLGHPLTVRAPFAFALVALAAIASAAALGLLLSSLFVLTRAAVRISEVLSYPVFLLGGMLIPLDYLPGWLRWPSALVSLGWARAGLERALAGRLDARALAMVLLLTLCYAALGWAVFSRVLDRARRKGTLELR